MKQVKIRVIAPNMNAIALAGMIDAPVLAHKKTEAAT
jgi:hypothetical protein